MLNFEELYTAYADDVYRFAYWLTGNTDDAQDIASETFVRAWVNFSIIRTETLKAYLFTIARNIYLDARRAGQNHTSLEETYPDTQPNPEKMLEAQNEMDLVRDYLLTLSEIDRSAFIMRVQYDFPYAEIARVLQLAEGLVKVKVHRIRKRLLARQLERSLHE